MPWFTVNLSNDGDEWWENVAELDKACVGLAFRLARIEDDEVFEVSDKELKEMASWPGWNDGAPLTEAPEPPEESNDCTACSGTGEGMAGGSCSWCHGRGYDRPAREPEFDTLEEARGER